MTEDLKPKGPRFKTWEERIAWLGRMPLRYRVLFGTQAVIFTLVLQYRNKQIDRIRLRAQAEQQKEQAEAESNSAASQ